MFVGLSDCMSRVLICNSTALHASFVLRMNFGLAACMLATRMVGMCSIASAECSRRAPEEQGIGFPRSKHSMQSSCVPTPDLYCSFLCVYAPINMNKNRSRSNSACTLIDLQICDVVHNLMSTTFSQLWLVKELSLQSCDGAVFGARIQSFCMRVAACRSMFTSAF